jgi:HEAT repeat protein
MKIPQIFVLFTAGCLLSLSGCQKKCKTGQDTDCWIQAMEDAQQRSKAIRELKSIGDRKAEPALIKAFTAAVDKPKQREELAELFKKWKSKAAAQVMLKAIDYNVGPDADSRKSKTTNRINQKIASALGAIQDPKSIDPLLRLMNSTRSPHTMRAAILALAHFRAKQAVDDLIKIVGKSSIPIRVRVKAIFALGEIGQTKAVPVLINALYKDKARLFAPARLALVNMGKAAVRPLIKTLTGRNPKVNEILDADTHILQGAMEANAAQVLGDIGDPSAVKPLLNRMKKVSTWDSGNRFLVLARLIAALGDIGDPGPVKDIQKYLGQDYLNIRHVVTGALTCIGDRKAMAGLLKAAHQGSVVERIAAMEAIGNLGTDKARAKIRKISKPGLAATKTKVLQQLQAFAQCKRSVDCWVARLSDKNPALREKAAYELGYMKDSKALQALLGLLGDPSVLVRWGVITALGKLDNPKAIDAITAQAKKDKGSHRYRVLNTKYNLLAAKLKNNLGR